MTDKSNSTGESREPTSKERASAQKSLDHIVEPKRRASKHQLTLITPPHPKISFPDSRVQIQKKKYPRIISRPKNQQTKSDIKTLLPQRIQTQQSLSTRPFPSSSSSPSPSLIPPFTPFFALWRYFRVPFVWIEPPF